MSNLKTNNQNHPNNKLKFTNFIREMQCQTHTHTHTKYSKKCEITKLAFWGAEVWREERRAAEGNSAEEEVNSESRVALTDESGDFRSFWSRGISVDDAEEESRCWMKRSRALEGYLARRIRSEVPPPAAAAAAIDFRLWSF